MDGWNNGFLLGWPNFQARAASFREGKLHLFATFAQPSSNLQVVA